MYCHWMLSWFYKCKFIGICEITEDYGEKIQAPEIFFLLASFENLRKNNCRYVTLQ